MRDLGRGEEHGRCIRAGRRARAATDAGRRFHRKIGVVLWNRNRVRFGRGTGARGDESACLHNAIEGAAIDHKVFDELEGPDAKRFHHDGGAIFEAPHVELAGGTRMIGPMRFAVDGERAAATDALATIRVERDRIFTPLRQPLIHDVERFEKGCVRRNIARLVFNKLPLRVAVFLAPDSEFKVHRGSGCCHPERSETESKDLSTVLQRADKSDGEILRLRSAPLHFAQNDKVRACSFIAPLREFHGFEM